MGKSLIGIIKSLIGVIVGASLAVLVLLIFDEPREVDEPEVAGTEHPPARLVVPESVSSEPISVEGTAESYGDVLTAAAEPEVATMELPRSDGHREMPGTQVFSDVDVETLRGEMPALPGLVGFDIPRAAGKQARELRDEVDNPVWSRLMEERIVSEVPHRLEFPVIALHSVCRSSICGLVYAYDHRSPKVVIERIESNKAGMYSCLLYSSSCVELGQELGDELGFSTLHGGFILQDDGLGYTFIYLSDWVGR